MNALSPSNRLYRGEVTNFLEAMECVVQQCSDEMLFCDRYGREFPEDKKHTKCDGLRNSLKALKSLAAKCHEEYVTRVKSAELALAKEWQKSEDEDLRRIGEALESGDYSDLAL